jgi:LysM repeat protein
MKKQMKVKLQEYKDLGIENILALRGDKPKDYDGEIFPGYHYANELVEAISWQEDVEVVKEFVDSTQILEQEDAVKVLESTTEATQSYTVQSGDAPYLIANEFKTTVEKLNQLNEGANLTGGIRVGQVINVPVQKPKISVKTVETQVLTAVEPKTYQTQYDDTKPSSYQKVIQQGKAGQKKSTIRITRINGEVTEEKEVDKEIIQEAVPEIIVKGTQ